MPDTRTAHAERASRALLWAQRLLIGSGVVLLAAVGLNLADSYVAQERARRALESVRPPALAIPVAPVVNPSADRQPAPPAAEPLMPIVPAAGAPVGELTIPRLELSAVVLHGDDARTLRHGPGHIPGTAWPGERGTVAIAGHRDSFFRPLRNIRLGDDIFLDTPQGRFGYRVSSLRIVGPNDVSVLRGDTASGSLTLITCYPFHLAGPAPDRFVVTAAAVLRPDGPVAPDAASVATVADEGGRAREDVRNAIARFQSGYNSRLARHPEAAAVPLDLRDCDITTDAVRGTATCEEGTPPAGRSGTWIFTLRPGPANWTIASVEPR